jgi:hypothetical protein
MYVMSQLQTFNAGQFLIPLAGQSRSDPRAVASMGASGQVIGRFQCCATTAGVGHWFATSADVDPRGGSWRALVSVGRARDDA